MENESGRRLTWQEICEKYPNQPVGLAEIEWGVNRATIQSAVVVYSGQDGMSGMQIASIAAASGGKIISENTEQNVLYAGGAFMI